MSDELANNQKNIEDILDVCLEDLQTRQERPQTILQRYPDQADELRPALDAAAWLSHRVEQFEPLPGFIPSSRRRLVERIHQDQSQAVARPAQRKAGLWDRFLLLFANRKLSYAFALAAALLIFLAASAGGVALAAENSLPGESLYPVKLASEEARLALTVRADRDAQLYLRYAERRLEEIEQLSAHGDYEYIHETAHDFENNVHKAAAALQNSTRIDAGRASSLAASLNLVLEKQRALVLVLARIAPGQIAWEFEQSVQAAEIDLANVAAALSPLLTQVTPGGPTATQTPEPPTAQISPVNPAIGPHSPTPPKGHATASTAVVSSTAGSPTSGSSPTPDTSIRVNPTTTPYPVIKPIETTPPSIQPTDPPSIEPSEPSEEPPTKPPKPTKKPKPTQKPRPEPPAPTRRPPRPGRP